VTQPLTLGDLAAALRSAADALDERARLAETERSEWVEQSASPLGRKRHCAAVRRRIEQGRDGAAIVGRRHLLSPGALREVMGEHGRRVDEPKAGAVQDLERALRLVGGSL
jgi:hypothetical protein